jgi:hypothetical protein
LYANVSYNTHQSKMNSFSAEADGATLNNDNYEDYQPAPF